MPDMTAYLAFLFAVLALWFAFLAYRTREWLLLVPIIGAVIGGAVEWWLW